MFTKTMAAVAEHIKKFVFCSQTCGSTDEKIEILIPEVGKVMLREIYIEYSDLFINYPMQLII